MSNIKPISDLRSYNTVLNECKEGNPVYLTKNGRGKYVVVDIDEYDKMQAEVQLFNELSKAENNSKWHTMDDVRKSLGV